MIDNVLIEASAGTGKTQALAERLIALVRAGAKPNELVALTFSRAAAGEIFERFVTLLAKTAAENHDDAELLREVVATQHLSQIGTLDAFLLRMVRVFPDELGIDGEMKLMDEAESVKERNRASFSILHRVDAATKRSFVSAFSLAMNGDNVRSFVDSYRNFIDEWHELVAEYPLAESWGDPARIWGTDKTFLRVTARELADAADRLEGIEDSDKWREFVAFVRNFRGKGLASASGYLKKMLETDIFSGAVVEFKFGNGADSVRRYGGEQAAAIRYAFQCIFGYIVRMKLDLARGVYTVISAYEREYDEKIRRSGRLVFADVPRLVARLDEARRLQLEYRMDSRLRSWALDEFQDTSRGQWRALSNLVDEALQSDGEKQVFIVGDRKQAIYGWRDGDVGIFERQAASGAYVRRELVRTYRSGVAIVDAVNRVFAHGPIANDYPAWRCPEHIAADERRVGFVQVADARGREKEDFVEQTKGVLESAVATARAHGRRLSIAVLVRNNNFGELLADSLKREGLDNVVWEGESPIAETPALSPFLDLVHLADHPGDMLVYRHFAMSRLARLRYPEGVPSAAEVSREFASSFTIRGIARTFRELRSLMPEDPEAAWSVYTEESFTDLLVAATEFELSMRAGTRLADFPDFVKARRKRNLAEPGKIKIMTIHRSKGLGFDYVVLPLYEPKGLVSESGKPLVGDGWVLPNPGKETANALAGLDRAYRDRCEREEQEALCNYYVAMTRAKTAMTILTYPSPKGAKARRFSDYVREAVPSAIGDPHWAENCGERISDVPGAVASVYSPPSRARRAALRRRLPSRDWTCGMSAAALFAPSSARQAAIDRGNRAHAELEKREWFPGSEKPEGFVELWRERSFELLDRGEWISGRFDRVVFFRKDGELCARVEDLKTGRGSDADYEPQLAAYRRAVSLLTGIPSSRITSVILRVF